ncbi:MAG: glycosyltransferase family 39 protein, partial [bacterium]
MGGKARRDSHDAERRKGRLYIASIIVLALILRVLGIDRNAFWYDESHTYFIAKADLSQLLRALKTITSPPMYYVLLKVWLALTEGFLNPRVFSLLWGLLGIYWIHALGRRLFDRQVGLLAALFLAFSPFHLRYSLELRMYTMLVALMTASTILLWKILEKNRLRDWLLFSLVNGLCLWTKYHCVFYLLTEYLFLIAYGMHRRPPRFVWNFVVSSVLLFGIFLSPLLLILLARQIVTTGTYINWVPTPELLDLPRCFLIVFIYYFPTFEEHWTLWVGSLSFFALLAIARPRVASTLKEQRAFLLCLSLAVLPILMMYAISFTPYKFFYLVRYVIVSLVPFLLLIAAALARARRRRLRTVLTLIFLASSIVFSIIQLYKPSGADWRKITRIIDSRVGPDDLLFANPVWWMESYNYYSDYRHRLVGFKDMIASGENPQEFFVIHFNHIGNEINSFPANLPEALKDFSDQEVLYRDEWYTLTRNTHVDMEGLRESFEEREKVRQAEKPKPKPEDESFVYRVTADSPIFENNRAFLPVEYTEEFVPYRWTTKPEFSLKLLMPLDVGDYKLYLGLNPTMMRLIDDFKFEVGINEEEPFPIDYSHFYEPVPFLFKVREPTLELRLNFRSTIFRPGGEGTEKDLRRLGFQLVWIQVEPFEPTLKSWDRYRYGIDFGSKHDKPFIVEGFDQPESEDRPFRWTHRRAVVRLPMSREDLESFSRLCILTRNNKPARQRPTTLYVYVNG